ARGAGRWRRDHHDRRTDEERRASSPAGSVSPAPRASVRLLHARYADDRARPASRAPRPDRRRDPRGTLGRALSLHRLPRHREGRAGGGAALARHAVAMLAQQLVNGVMLGAVYALIAI